MNGLGLFFSLNELRFIREKFGDRGTINYEKLVTHLEQNFEQMKIEELSKKEADKNKEEKDQKLNEQHRRETNVVEVCAKIKTILICKKTKMADVFQKKDPNNCGLVSWRTFKESCTEMDLNLTENELNTLHHNFRSEENEDMIEYPLFTRVVDELSIIQCLTRRPLKEEMQQRRSPQAPLEHEFVNFEERIRISRAMKILSKHITLAHMDVFKAEDVEGRGLVNRTKFMQLLQKLGVLHLISMQDVESLLNGFGHKENHDFLLDYTSWLKALDIVFRTEKAAMNL